jgi:hypothetical protein
MKKLVLLITVFFLAAGCASLDELSGKVMEARETGREGLVRIYPVSNEEAWEITRAVFLWEKTDDVQERRDRNYCITSTGMKMVAFGSVMGVWIEPVDENNTRITVITRRRVDSDTFTQLTGPKFMKRFEQGVTIVKGGKKLSARPPEYPAVSLGNN